MRIFRVDNPHTKPLPFWEWLIADVRGRDPRRDLPGRGVHPAEDDVPAGQDRLLPVLHLFHLAQHQGGAGRRISPSSTTGPAREYFRPHLFVNTPDINPRFLQTSGRAGFLIRAALAATLSGLWGMYSGFELCEAAPLPGREEYLDSEKYELRPRDWTRPGNIIAEIARLNRIRRDNPALWTHLGLRFYHADNDMVLLYGKATPDRGNVVLVAVNLDPHARRRRPVSTCRCGNGDWPTTPACGPRT